MEIAFLVNNFPSLSETFILSQITGLIDAGHKVTIFASGGDTKNVLHDDVKKYGLLNHVFYRSEPSVGTVVKLTKLLKAVFKNFKAVNLFAFYNRLKGSGKFWKEIDWISTFLHAKKRFDIIHCQFGELGEIGVLLKETVATDAKIVTSFRGYDLTSFLETNGKDFYKPLFAKGDLFLPVCSYFKDILVSLGCPASKIEVLYSGINLKKFRYHPIKREHQEKIFKMVTVGRLVEKKGVSYALQAISKIIQKAPHLKLNFDIIGDGPLLQKHMVEVETLGIGNSVSFLGSKKHDEIVNLLCEYDLMVTPCVIAENGDQEGIPNVLKEAMAIGLPVLSTYHSGIPELIGDGKTGYLVNERDAGALADKIEFLIQNQQELMRVTQPARQFIEDYFEINMLNSTLISQYQTAINK